MDPQAEQAAFSKQYDAEQAQKAQQESARTDQQPSLLERFAAPVGRVTTSMLDSVVSEAEQWGTAAKRVGQDAAAGVVTGATNIVDAAHSGLESAARHIKLYPGDPGADPNAPDPLGPIWDHAKSAILDFRDAIAVKDPNTIDGITQGAAQLAVPFAGYSRALSSLHGIANVVAAGVATDATALAPHDMRMADVFALGRHTEGKLGEVLRTLAPDGSALNGYINFLADRTDETEAEGRFKNVLDGLGVNLVTTPLLHAAAVALKQGTAGVRYAMENGVRNTVSDLFPPGPAPGSPGAQAGKIVFHGTPHNFDEFDTSKIGSGEGNQAYGHGLYFAEDAATAGAYQKKLAFRGQPELAAAAQNLAAFNGNRPKAYMDFMLKAEKASDPNVAAKFRRQADFIKSGAAEKGGNLMHVDIPDETIGAMLDHDKPMESQPGILAKIPKNDREQLETLLDDHDQDSELESYTGNQFRQIVERAINEGYLLSPSGSGNAAKDAAAYLNSVGIPGIKYLDRGSRNAGTGTRNIVLFDAKHATIVKKE